MQSAENMIDDFYLLSCAGQLLSGMAVKILGMDQDSAKPPTVSVYSPDLIDVETPDAEAIHIQRDDSCKKSPGKFNIRESLDEVLQDFLSVLSREKIAFGHSTGFDHLDRIIGGLRPGKMLVIAARPSMGKTSLMLNIVEHVCIDKNVPTLIFAGAMPASLVVERMLFCRAEFVLSRLWREDYQPTKDELRRIRHAATEISNANIFVDDFSTHSIDELCVTARRFKQEKNIGFIVIDDLSSLKSDSPRAKQSREREVAEVSCGIKSLARELDIPILVLASLNRKPDSRDWPCPGFPRMSDLRPSGTIVNDADVVGLLHRPSYYATTDEEGEAYAGKAELVIAKNRDGEIGGIPLYFIAELMRFKNAYENPVYHRE